MRAASTLRGAASALAGVVPMAVLGACDVAAPGHPISARPPVHTTTNEATDYSLARLCELISADEAVSLGGAAEGETSNSVSDGHEICTWADKTQLIVGFQDGLTTADVRTGPGVTNTPTTIDGLTAVQSLQTDPVTLCQVLVDLPSEKLFTSSARVRSAGEGQYDPCQVATELSNLVIPRIKGELPTTSAAPTDFSGEALCELLTPEEATQLGGSAEGEPKLSTTDGHPQCQWANETSILVGFQKGTQSKNARTGTGITNTPTTVAGLTAMKSLATKPTDVCQVLVDVSPDAIVYGSAAFQSSGEGKYDLCAVAEQLVDIVIPKVTQR